MHTYIHTYTNVMKICPWNFMLHIDKIFKVHSDFLKCSMYHITFSESWNQSDIQSLKSIANHLLINIATKRFIFLKYKSFSIALQVFLFCCMVATTRNTNYYDKRPVPFQAYMWDLTHGENFYPRMLHHI